MNEWLNTYKHKPQSNRKPQTNKIYAKRIHQFLHLISYSFHHSAVEMLHDSALYKFMIDIDIDISDVQNRFWLLVTVNNTHST